LISLCTILFTTGKSWNLAIFCEINISPLLKNWDNHYREQYNVKYWLDYWKSDNLGWFQIDTCVLVIVPIRHSKNSGSRDTLLGQNKLGVSFWDLWNISFSKWSLLVNLFNFFIKTHLSPLLCGLVLLHIYI
jgi:hypothetical protein